MTSARTEVIARRDNAGNKGRPWGYRLTTDVQILWEDPRDPDAVDVDTSTPLVREADLDGLRPTIVLNFSSLFNFDDQDYTFQVPHRDHPSRKSDALDNTSSPHSSNDESNNSTSGEDSPSSPAAQVSSRNDDVEDEDDQDEDEDEDEDEDDSKAEHLEANSKTNSKTVAEVVDPVVIDSSSDNSGLFVDEGNSIGDSDTNKTLKASQARNSQDSSSDEHSDSDISSIPSDIEINAKAVSKSPFIPGTLKRKRVETDKGSPKRSRSVNPYPLEKRVNRPKGAARWQRKLYG